MKKSIFNSKNLAAVLFAVTLTFFLIPLFGIGGASAFGAAIVLSNFLPSPSGILGMNNTNNMSAAESYLKAKRMFWRAFRDKFQTTAKGGNDAQGDQDCLDFVESLKLSQSEIRLEVGLTAAATQFLFALTPNQQNTSGIQFNTERRLNLQDSFCANEYGIMVGQPSSNTDTTWQLRTYPNTQDFAAADVAALASTFYSHGWFEMRCNNDVIMPYRGLWNHLYKPQTQQTAALGAASPADQLRGAEDGFITDEPNIVLIGSKGYIPQISLPVNLASASEFERAIIIFRGVLAQNSTVVS